MKQRRPVPTWPMSTLGRSPRVTTRSARSAGCAATWPEPRTRSGAPTTSAADPQPGLALAPARSGAIRHRGGLDPDRARRAGRQPAATCPKLCVAQVQIALAIGDLETARAACAELEQTAGIYESSGLAAAVQQARGALLLREGAPAEAVTVLRAACRGGRTSTRSIEAASIRLLLAEAYRSLGDEDAAQLELSAADAVFEQLGAEPGRRRVASLRGRGSLPGGLTEREVEVLRLVATGVQQP